MTSLKVLARECATTSACHFALLSPEKWDECKEFYSSEPWFPKDGAMPEGKDFSPYAEPKEMSAEFEVLPSLTIKPDDVIEKLV